MPTQAKQDHWTPPTVGILSYLPPSWVPYAELARIDKPLACLYLYFPCAFGTLLAACMADSTVSSAHLIEVNLTFLLGSFLVRCAGCSWNDIVDQDLDRHVARTRLRPLARRAIGTRSAVVFTAAQVATGYVLVYLLMPGPCIYFSIPSVFLTALYPYGKRFTHYPQLILGSVFSWGVPMAFPALELDLLSQRRSLLAAGLLYLSCISWTFCYDTIYSAQDIRDDLKTGIKSPVVQYQHKTRQFLAMAGFVQIALLCYTGVVMEAGFSYFVLTCGGTTFMMGRMLFKVDLQDPKDCIRWFKKASFHTGLSILSGFLATHIERVATLIPLEQA